MEVNQEGMPIPGGWSTSKTLRVRKRTAHCGSIVPLNTKIKKVNFSMKTLKGYRSCLDRQVNESVRVTRSKAHNLLNSKNEFHQTPIIRVIAASGLHGDQGESQEATLTAS